MASTPITLKVHDLSGKPTKDVTLDPKVFGVTIDTGLLHLVTTAYQANKRLGLAHTKTKGEVRGGGRKPWKQKGTGQARQGSIRSPQWRGGGKAFGPRTGRNWSKDLTTKVKRKALAMALTSQAEKQRIILVDSFPAEGKTKPVMKFLQALKANRSALIIPASHDAILVRATRNMPEVEILRADSLNTYDILRAHYLVVAEKSLDVIGKHYTTKA